MNKLIFLVLSFFLCFLDGHTKSTDQYRIPVKIVDGPEYIAVVHLPSPTTVESLKSAVQKDLKNNFHIHIPTEKLILRKEGAWMVLPNQQGIRSEDNLYIVGRVPR